MEIEYKGGDNLYAYVYSRPVAFVDPSGLDVFIGINADHPLGSLIGGLHQSIAVGPPSGAESWTHGQMGIYKDGFGDTVPAYPDQSFGYIPTDRAIDELIKNYIDGHKGPLPYWPIPLFPPLWSNCRDWSWHMFDDIQDYVEQIGVFDPKKGKWVLRGR